MTKVEAQRLQIAIRLLTQSYFVQGESFANRKFKKKQVLPSRFEEELQKHV